MKSRLVLGVVSVVVFSLLGWQSIASAENRQWAGKMQALSQALAEIMPDVVSQKPLTPQATKRLERGAKTIADLAHNIKMGSEQSPQPLPPDADPSIPFVAALFQQQSQHAYNLMREGYPDAGRAVLRVLTGYCIACHTRGDQGPDFPTLPLKLNTNTLSPMERGDLFAATRQFDKAMSEYEKVIADSKTASARKIEWSKAVRRALTIAVRVKKDPAKAEEILKKTGAVAEVPEFFKTQVKIWQASVATWKSEAGKKFEGEKALYDEANRLITEAKALQKYPMDNSADILYLRASAVLHDLLIQFPQGKMSGEVMLLIGQTYSVLEDPTLLLLPDLYYQTCIRHEPHTKTAEKCYQAFEESVYFGYTGSGGTSVPVDMEKTMAELKKLAYPKKK